MGLSHVSADLSTNQITSCMTIDFLISDLTFLFQRFIKNSFTKEYASILGCHWKCFTTGAVQFTSRSIMCSFLVPFITIDQISGGSSISLGAGTNLLFGIIFAENFMNIKNIGLWGGSIPRPPNPSLTAKSKNQSNENTAMRTVFRYLQILSRVSLCGTIL